MLLASINTSYLHSIGVQNTAAFTFICHFLSNYYCREGCQAEHGKETNIYEDHTILEEIEIYLCSCVLSSAVIFEPISRA